MLFMPLLSTNDDDDDDDRAHHSGLSYFLMFNRFINDGDIHEVFVVKLSYLVVVVAVVVEG